MFVGSNKIHIFYYPVRHFYASEAHSLPIHFLSHVKKITRGCIFIMFLQLSMSNRAYKAMKVTKICRLLRTY